MKKEGNYTLIKGSFNTSDAKTLLRSLVQYKINFHQVRNFSFQERFGKKEPKGEKRVAELTKCLEQILDLLDRNDIKGQKFKIHAEINILANK